MRDTEAGILASLQRRALEAVSKARPIAPAERLAAYTAPLQLLGELARSGKDPLLGQLVYSQLLLALLSSRLVAEFHWPVPPSRLLEECGKVDSTLSAWVAASMRKPFTTDMLPALRVRTKSVLVRLGLSGDESTPPQFDLDDMMVGLARRNARAKQAIREKRAMSA